ncbi:hypothetical protein KM043_007795 [Ampulex compressa]|nr:hypothetical protein KM043_007795 [Ampulex compressa]
MNSNLTSYISSACNRVPHAADWGRNGLICYAACHAIAVHDPHASKLGKTLQTLHHHKDRINTVKWIKKRNGGPESELISGSVDGTAIIWNREKPDNVHTSVLQVGDTVNFVCALYLSDDVTCNDTKVPQLLVCTGSVSGDLKVWLREECQEAKCIQTISFERKLPLQGGLSYLPITDQPILAVAIEDASIQLFTRDMSVTDFTLIKVQVLVGHDDWVNCIDFAHCDDSLLLATGSQDTMIRLWNISTATTKVSEEKLQLKKQMFEVGNEKYTITVESILCGHEGWVYGIDWCPPERRDGKLYQPMKLLSCSLDKSMIIWEPDPSTGIWFEKVRVGEVGGNSLGFYGCKFGGNGSNILAHGYQGSFHIWEYSDSVKNWTPKPVPSGHFAEVIDLSWDPKGRFFLTVSADQTTRIHAPWKEKMEEVWHEIGRPQVHGYDMSCLAMLSPYMFASGAEEKVVRIFAAPTSFKNHLMKIVNVDDFKNVIADSASVPALGLTNKAIFSENVKSEENSSTCVETDDYVSPTEEELVQNTLWPEIQKLYGHGYEIFSMAARHDGKLLATACKSASVEHSAILIWNMETWSECQRLSSHKLTVTQMEFSPNDKYLLSVSRDRTWSLFEYDDHIYNLIAVSGKKNNFHSRIIWCCTWTHNSQFFATGSRDGKIGIWNQKCEDKQTVVLNSGLERKNQSVTALSFAPHSLSNDSYLLAIGYETGNIEIQKLVLATENSSWTLCITYDSSQAHHLTVKRLKFRPQVDTVNNTLQLASCGTDHFVKIYNINVSEVQKL